MSERLPNGLTTEQDEAFANLAAAIVEHMQAPCDGCMFHDNGADA